MLDGTIVGVSLPAIISDLSLTVTDAQWITSIYSVVFAALLLTMGRASDRFGRTTVFLLGIAIFLAGSVIAGFANSIVWLIVARTVQGIGGAMILPSTLSTVNVLFRGKDRAAAFGVWGAVMAGAAALGPLAGGVLTQYAGWHWIFWINVPIGLVLLVLGWRLIPNTQDPNARFVDFPGVALSALGFGALVYAIIQSSWVAGGVAAAALIAFIVCDPTRMRAGKPVLLDLTMFRTSTFTWGNITALCVAMGEFALVFVLPLYLVSAVGLSTLTTGFILAAMAAGAFLAGASARHLAAAVGPTVAVLIGLALEVMGTAQLAAEDVVGRPLWLVVVALPIYGVGLGIASAQLTSTVLVDVPVAQSGAASATQSTVRQIGSALGAALAGTVLSAAITRYGTGNPMAETCANLQARCGWACGHKGGRMCRLPRWWNCSRVRLSYPCMSPAGFLR